MAAAAAALESFIAGIASEYRNAEPIVHHLQRLLRDLRAHRAATGGGSLSVVELGSGTCEHAAFFTHVLSSDALNLLRVWQPTDLAAANRIGKGQVQKYIDMVPSARNVLKEPLEASASNPVEWQRAVDSAPALDGFDVCFTSCTFHIMPWEACRSAIHNICSIALSRQPGSLFLLYGPFNYNGRFTSESNERFDAYLKRVNPQQGIRNFDDIAALFEVEAMTLLEDIPMPENNRLLAFARRAAAT